MYSVPVRLTLILICVAYAAHSFANERLVLGCSMLLGAGFLVYGYFQYGTVWLAFRELRAGRTDRARDLLDQIGSPNSLRSQHRAYYELMRGSLASEAEDWDAATGHLQTALEHQLRTPNDRALTEALFAQALFYCGQESVAWEHLELARRLKHKPELNQTIGELESLFREGRSAANTEKPVAPND